MEAHLHRDIPLIDLAAVAGWSVRHFSRRFRQETGRTPHDWILGKRVERAKDLLGKPKLPLAEIALSCGFADQSHFTTAFRRLTDTTPLRWRRQNLRPCAEQSGRRERRADREEGRRAETSGI